MTRSYWLVKSEPDAFSWEQHVAAGTEPWTGVRSHQAKNNLARMREGDHAFFYHSNIGREIVGIVEITREAYPDPTHDAQFPWLAVDMRAIAPLARPVPLTAIKAHPHLQAMALVRFSRLSVAPVTPEEWAHVTAMAE